jgi:ABC-type multidrug transport system fused ATPase/permease subunit
MNTLRQRLSAIPQEPLFFSGTMRENLDPQGNKTDAELHDALQRCGLVQPEGQNQDRFSKFKLDAQIADEGSPSRCQQDPPHQS